MTKKSILPTIIVASVAAVVYTAKALSSGTQKVYMGDKFSLKVGSKAKLYNRVSLEYIMSITFSEMIQDTRCPINEECEQEGMAEARIKIETADRTTRFITLPQAGYLYIPWSIPYEDYTINFMINPYPVSGEIVSLREYTLDMEIVALVLPPPLYPENGESK